MAVDIPRDLGSVACNIMNSNPAMCLEVLLFIKQVVRDAQNIGNVANVAITLHFINDFLNSGSNKGGALKTGNGHSRKGLTCNCYNLSYFR